MDVQATPCALVSEIRAMALAVSDISARLSQLQGRLDQGGYIAVATTDTAMDAAVNSPVDTSLEKVCQRPGQDRLRLLEASIEKCQNELKTNVLVTRQEWSKMMLSVQALKAARQCKCETRLEVLDTRVQHLRDSQDRTDQMLNTLDINLHERIKSTAILSKREWRRLVQDKVDTSVIEELMRHLVTKEYLKRYMDKQFGCHEVNTRHNKIHPTTKVDSVDTRVKLPKKHASQVESDLTKMQQGDKTVTEKQRKHQYQQQHDVSATTMATDQTSVKLHDHTATMDVYDMLHYRLSRSVDEKLFLIASELSAVKVAYSTTMAHPFLRSGLWLWKSSSLKHGSSIPWNIEAQNTDPYNLTWEPDQPTIRIAEAGLYELTFAFFTKSKPSLQVVVNGESVCSAIHSPTYMVHHGSGYVMGAEGKMRPGTITGMSLVEFICVPAKSTLSLHWHGKVEHAVEGFVGLKRLGC